MAEKAAQDALGIPFSEEKLLLATAKLCGFTSRRTAAQKNDFEAVG